MIFANELREQVFYNNLFNRTRRRFVFANTAKRKPHAVTFSLSENEMNIYNRVTHLVKAIEIGLINTKNKIYLSLTLTMMTL